MPDFRLILLHAFDCRSVLGSSPSALTLVSRVNYDTEHGSLTEMLCCMATKLDWRPLLEAKGH